MIVMQTKLISFLLLLSFFACQQQNNTLQIENLPRTKHLLDSALQVLEKMTFTKDTSFNEEFMRERKLIEVSIQTIDTTKNRLALVAVKETDTSYFRVFIFEVQQPRWKFLDSINDYGDNQLIPEAKLLDVDFDGQKDLLLTSHCLSSRIVSRVDCFGFDRGSFKTGLRKITELYSSGFQDKDLVFDKDSIAKTITCYTDGGLMGIEEAKVYRWQQDTLQLFRQLEMVYDDTFFIYRKADFVKRGITLTTSEELKEGDTIGYQMFLNEYELVNGKMKLIKQAQDFQEGAMLYFENWK